MSKPQDHEQCDDDSVEDDLKILQEMDIDQDFNSWGDFRNSIAVQGKRESLESLVKRKSSKSYRSPSVSVSQSGHSGASQDMYNISENSSCSFETGEMEKDISHRSGDSELNVSFSALTSGEKRDLRAWNMRLARDTVFSRYYFPEAWETREMKTIEKFIELENPHENPWFFNKPGQEATKAAIASVFFPGDHDPKSVLLKRGPVLLDAVAERELLLFTHGFFIARIEFDNLLNILFTINSENPQYLNSKQLKDRFDAIDSDNSGSLDRCELKEVFSSMGVPIGESALSDIIERFDDDNDGTIDFAEFESVMRELEPKPKEEDGWSLDSIGKKLRGSLLAAPEVERKLDLAFQFSDIEKFESINACHSEPTEMFADSSWADLIFAIYVKGREDPLIMVCSKPEHRLAWVDAFRTCYVKSTMLKCQSGFRDAKKICDRVGWQHRTIRASLFSLVVCNDLTGLKQQISNPSEDMEDIDDQDEYHGFTALHYAAALGRIDCARILIQHKARMNVQDNDQMTPLDHATLSINKAMMQLLERHGAKKHTTAEVLFKSAFEEQEKMKSEKSPTSGAKTVAKAKQAAGAMSHAVSALRERGERLERLDDKTAQLQSGASNYADMAKKLKEKNKKKANLFGMY